MGLLEVLNIILPVVYVLVGCVLVWFVVELVLTVRVARKTVGEVQEQLEPTLVHVEKITADLEPTMKSVKSITAQIDPVVGKVDPLVDRVSLTVDAANLEIMRVDQILEDVNQITGSITKTMDTVDTVTSAPLELVNTVTSKMRSRFKPRYASEESVKLGQEAEGEAPANPVRDFVDAATDAAESAVVEQRASMRERKAARAAHRRAAHERTDSINEAMGDVSSAVVATSGADADAIDQGEEQSAAVGYTKVASTPASSK